jgi:hypothetical protein
MIKNILEDIVYIAPIEGLPIPEGMCVTCYDQATSNTIATEASTIPMSEEM